MSEKTAPKAGSGRAIGLLAAALAAFYWVPLTSPEAGIQWDAVDVHYSSQRYFAESLGRGLPFWTPHLFSGFPFLADPQVGAFYPLNWPFFALGVTPLAIQVEIALHALLACVGAFLLWRMVLGHTAAALAGSMFYGLSGFFAGHSSHLGMLASAAWLPWLLYFFGRFVQGAGLRWVGAAGLAGGAMILAGHFQTSLYAFAGLALFTAHEVAGARPRLARAAAGLLAVAVLAAGISAVQSLPGLELARHSVRAGADYSASADGSLTIRSLETLLSPDALHALSGEYTGPADITQHYLYAGILLLPLALAGVLADRRVRRAALLLAVPALWYAFGPEAGLHRALSLLPGFRQLRGPVHAWFLVALGLALAAGAGAAWVFRRWKFAWLPPVLLAAVFLDAAWFNSWNNPLAYARAGFDELYGNRLKLCRERLAPAVPAGTRFHAPSNTAFCGPMNHPLDLRLEATYGYNPLELKAYSEFRQAAAGNPRLLDALGVSRELDAGAGAVVARKTILPRAWFPKRVVRVDPSESLSRLASLDPASEATTPEATAAATADPEARAEIAAHGESWYRIRYRSKTAGLLVVSVPHFPGWRATVDGAAAPVVVANHALSGIVAPQGDREVLLEYRSNYFVAGALISLGTLALAVFLLFRPAAQYSA